MKFRRHFLNMVVLMAAGMAWMLTTTTVSITVQLFVPRWVMGRAIATTTAATSLGVASGSWVWGMVAHDYGLTVAFEVAAAALGLGWRTGFFADHAAAVVAGPVHGGDVAGGCIS